MGNTGWTFLSADWATSVEHANSISFQKPWQNCQAEGTEQGVTTTTVPVLTGSTDPFLHLNCPSLRFHLNMGLQLGYRHDKEIVLLHIMSTATAMRRHNVTCLRLVEVLQIHVHIHRPGWKSWMKKLSEDKIRHWYSCEMKSLINRLLIVKS